VAADDPVPASALLTRDPAVAAAALRSGRLAVLPTETVYGLGAVASDPHAIARVYAVKARPADHPLIVHLAGVERMDGWAARVPEYAHRLAHRCWPGPLTLVLPRSRRVGDQVTGGQDTVALRVPDHPLTLAVLRLTDDGVAAPSANRFGRVSPTTAQHALDEIGDRLVPGRDIVLDGGPCRVGVESTIVDCTGPAPRLLRPGAVSAEQVASVGGVPLDRSASAVRAPGTLASHYAPRARVVVVGDVRDVPAGPVNDAPSGGLLAPAEVPTPPGVVRLAAPSTVDEYAAGLYAALREADALALRTVHAVPPAGDGLAVAVRDRLARAAAPPARPATLSPPRWR
jgi:L-threonylcarbamoyladenylate synthase